MPLCLYQVQKIDIVFFSDALVSLRQCWVHSYLNHSCETSRVPSLTTLSPQHTWRLGAVAVVTVIPSAVMFPLEVVLERRIASTELEFTSPIT